MRPSGANAASLSVRRPGEHPALDPACRLPEDHVATRPAGGQGRAVGRVRQGDVAQHPMAGGDAVQLLAGARVPDPDVAVVRRGDPPAVGGEGQAPTQPAPLRNVTCESGAAAGQSLTVPSRLPEAASSPSGPKATQWTNPVWPWKVALSPPSRSQRRTLLSSLPETSWRPSGEKARPRTNPRWPPRMSHAGRCPVPDADGLVPAAGGHAAAVRAEGDRVDEVDVAAQAMGDRPLRPSRGRRGRRRRGWPAPGCGRRARRPRPSTPPGPPAIGGPSSPPVAASRMPDVAALLIVVELPAAGGERAAVGRERQAEDLHAPLDDPPELAPGGGVEQQDDRALRPCPRTRGPPRGCGRRANRPPPGRRPSAGRSAKTSAPEWISRTTSSPVRSSPTPPQGPVPAATRAPSGANATHQTSRPSEAAVQLLSSAWPSRRA